MSQRYFNFPVFLLNDFLTDTETALNKIRDYALYSYAMAEYGYAEL